jgi:hypothetical protein
MLARSTHGCNVESVNPNITWTVRAQIGRCTQTQVVGVKNNPNVESVNLIHT